jgi:hypothetical protein
MAKAIIKGSLSFPNPPKLKDIASKFIVKNNLPESKVVTTSKGLIIMIDNEACLLYETVEKPNGQEFGGTRKSDILTDTYTLEGVLNGKKISLEARYTFNQPETDKPIETTERIDSNRKYWFVKEAKK